MRIVGSLFALALLAACGEGSSTGQPKADATEYVARATVLESPKHGPQLCFAMNDSLPPQCGGPDITNWSWAKASGEESALGTTWGDYVVYGTYADGDFTLTRPPADPAKAGVLPVEEEPDFSTPCPEPEGGWFPADRPRIGDDEEEGLQMIDQAAAHASSLPGYAGLWLDQRADEQAQENDPNGIILNVRVTKDVEGAEAAMLKVWPGALCVSVAKYTDKELQRIQEEVHDRVGKAALGSSADNDRVDIDVFLDEGGRLQKEFDEEYGKGTVRVTSALRPAPPL